MSQQILSELAGPALPARQSRPPLCIGRQTPIVKLHPTNQCALAGTNVVFTASGLSAGAPVSYQWQFNNANIAGATTTALTLNNVQSANQGSYHVIITNSAGSTTSQDAALSLVGPPLIASQTQPTNWQILYGTNLTLSVVATNTGNCSFPITYTWSLNGKDLGIYTTNYTIAFASATNAGVYSVLINNGACCTNVSWTVDVAGEGRVIWWGSMTQAWNYLPGITNVISLAGGGNHALLVEETGVVIAWGTNTYGQTNVPASATNAVAVAAGDAHSLALKADGTVVAWGRTNASQTNVPNGLTSVIAIAAGGDQSLALLKDGTATNWGATFGTVPSDLTNIMAIAAGTNFSLGLRTNSTVVAWGGNGSPTNVPSGLTNVVAIAAGGGHALALRTNGTVIAWGNNSNGQTNVPTDLTNAMAVAAGYAHSMAIRNDGTLVEWGGNTYGQTNNPFQVEPQLKLIAAAGYQSLVSIFSPLVQYSVDVTKDLLLIYNSTSTNSIVVKDYYLAHRPMVAGANVLPISCSTNEIIDLATFTNQLAPRLLQWLTNNPTKHPQYLVLFPDMPSSVFSSTNGGAALNSVAYGLSTNVLGVKPFVTSINMGLFDATNDCLRYIDKLATIGASNSPGQLILSASAGI